MYKKEAKNMGLILAASHSICGFRLKLKKNGNIKTIMGVK